MAKALMIIPTHAGVGLNATTLGLVRSIAHQGIKVVCYKPVVIEHGFYLAAENLPQPIPITRVEKYISEGRLDDLLDAFIGNFESYAEHADLVVVQGINDVGNYAFSEMVNTALAKALSAEIILISTPRKKTIPEMKEQIDVFLQKTGLHATGKELGLIINKINAPVDYKGHIIFHRDEFVPEILIDDFRRDVLSTDLFKRHNIKLLATISWDHNLMSPRVRDVVNLTEANVLFPGDLDERRVGSISVCARSVTNMLDVLKPGALIITPSDRSDIIVTVALAVMSGVKIAALLLTGPDDLPENMIKLCDGAIKAGLPILSVKKDSFRTAIMLNNLNFEIQVDDTEMLETISDYMANHIDSKWIIALLDKSIQRHMTLPAFRYRLLEKARRANKTIVLPEGNEERTLRAACSCAQKGIAKFILLGDPEEILSIAEHNGLTLPDSIKIINPEQVREQYVDALVDLRKHKGLTVPFANEYLKDNIVLGMMMLHHDEVDGLVAGAINTTANTIRPALQVIKTAPGNNIVSSVFFMGLPDQVLVFGDCAINPDPTAEQLAEIALQSAITAQAFGVTPIIAMISYSTGSSGAGADVEKVKAAVKLIKEQNPQLIVDGPLQYDAALIESVAKKKAPGSPVAGKANVLIFPDLNTGNTTYKAVQRSANVLSIGPVLQGLNKPVNDLSRGATVEDIIFTIAITAIQACI